MPGGSFEEPEESEESLEDYVGIAVDAARDEGLTPTLLIDQYLKNAVEVKILTSFARACVKDPWHATNTLSPGGTLSLA